MVGPLIAIVGPTASGKTALSLKLAKKFNGEIIAADSRTIYKGMDIGTAKPTGEEQAAVPHHLIDIVTPDQLFTVADFVRHAQAAIDDVLRRKKIPILVGGSGLYIDALLYGYKFVQTDSKLRAELEQLTTEELQRQVEHLGVELNQSDYANRRRLVRAVESSGQPRQKGQLRSHTLMLGLEVPFRVLEKRISQRTESMIQGGLLDETKALLDVYGPEVSTLQAIGYQEAGQFIEGQIDRSQLSQLLNLHTRQLAKRQLTWFKRNPDITWVSNETEAIGYAKRFLDAL